ncbi:pentapeptide repeat-containing protein [Nocardia brasiliensis]|uniref:pentapeptide repeat-containing protein n=1 Tax=Nocardia brasiliensis TaxID=37326 RepID=UPI00366FFE35
MPDRLTVDDRRTPLDRPGGANLTAAEVQGVNLAGSSLLSANISNAVFVNVNLAGAVLVSANASNTHFKDNTNLHRTRLYCARLEGSNLKGTRESRISEATPFPLAATMQLGFRRTSHRCVSDEHRIPSKYLTTVISTMSFAEKQVPAGWRDTATRK